MCISDMIIHVISGVVMCFFCFVDLARVTVVLRCINLARVTMLYLASVTRLYYFCNFRCEIFCP